MDYKQAYFELQGELENLIEHIQNIQQKYEEMYISDGDSGEE